MSHKILLKKTCSIYASDLHLATIMFPYINKELREQAMVKTILENSIESSMEKVISHTTIHPETEEKIKQIDWKKTTIEKIKQTLNEIEKELKEKDKIDIIVSGSNFFIDKVNQLVDVWIKANLEEIQHDNKILNVVNCYHLKQNNEIEDIMHNHEYILRTAGIQEIFEKENLKKAN